ncbi:MAG TPA: glycosyltransferase [Bryobacteraceae bacterium]|nr:glycosyltransferase [Bryobacteraceae bacterium]
MSAENGRRYLLVTHIPFARTPEGPVRVDALWARDLAGLVASVGPIRVAAPELRPGEAMETWGPTAALVAREAGVSFAGFPPIARRTDLWKWPRIRAVLRREVAGAALVHTSNFFAPYVGLSYAHDVAVRSGKQTLFVIAEDFYDMLAWEWVRPAGQGWEGRRRRRHLEKLDRRVRRSASTATLTFLHTPAAVARYRLAARHGVAIRQPGHEVEDVISAQDLRQKCEEAARGGPLVLIAACRHKPLKGLDLLIGAVALLAAREVRVEARLYGQGEAGDALRALAERLGVADRVRFPGALPPGEAIYRAIAEGHLFVMPHRTTDFGRAFFDAMAGGTPVIAFRTPASVETVRDGVDGLLAPLDDVEGLAEAIHRFHADRALLARAAAAARERGLHNTRQAWFQLRAAWIRSLFAEEVSR